MSDIIRTFRQVDEISDADLWDQFCGDMTPAKMIACYGGPEELGVHSAGYAATPEIAAHIEKRLWNYALERKGEESSETEIADPSL